MAVPKRVMRDIQEKISEVLDEIKEPRHRAIFQLCSEGHTHRSVAKILGYSSDRAVSRVWSNHRYRELRQRIRRAQNDLLVQNHSFRGALIKLRNEKVIPTLEYVLEHGEPRDMLNAVRTLGEWTGMGDKVVEVRGQISHRHVLESPEMRRLRVMLDDGTAVIEGDAPPPFEVVEAEVIEDADEAG